MRSIAPFTHIIELCAKTMTWVDLVENNKTLKSAVVMLLVRLKKQPGSRSRGPMVCICIKIVSETFAISCEDYVWSQVSCRSVFNLSKTWDSRSGTLYARIPFRASPLTACLHTAKEVRAKQCNATVYAIHGLSRPPDIPLLDISLERYRNTHHHLSTD